MCAHNQWSGGKPARHVSAFAPHLVLVRPRTPDAGRQPKMAASGEAREPSLEALFAAAAASAKREQAALETNEAWQVLTQEVLPPLAQAQELLLEPELRRCTEMQHRRKRPCAVRFSCYDLASLDHPSSQLLEVLLQLRAAQQRLLRMP